MQVTSRVTNRITVAVMDTEASFLPFTSVALFSFPYVITFFFVTFIMLAQCKDRSIDVMTTLVYQLKRLTREHDSL